MTSEPTSILGTRVLRTEDPRFLRGESVYTCDLIDDRLAGAAHAVFVRSSVAHAQIAVDASPATQAAGVLAAYTAEDLDLRPIPPSMQPEGAKPDRPQLAVGRVRFVGEPVAVVLAETEQQATDAAELVDLDYDFLDPVIDVSAAAHHDVRLFDDLGSNVAKLHGADAELDPPMFADCEVSITQQIRNPRLAVVPLETRAAAAVWGDDGRLTAWIPNQGAQDTKKELVEMLGVHPDRVRVITPDVGGAFGARFGCDPEAAVVCAAASRLGRAVRWTEHRSDNLLAMTHGRGQLQTICIGGRRDGRITAYRLEVLQDSGAYPDTGTICRR